MNDIAKTLFIWLLIAVVLLLVFNSFTSSSSKTQHVAYSEFVSAVDNGGVKKVTFDGLNISGCCINGSDFKTYSPVADFNPLLKELRKNDTNVTIEAKPPEKPSWILQALFSFGPILLLVVFWFYIMRQMQGGGASGRGAMAFGKSKARLLGEDQVKVTFADVAGVEEAKEEVAELVEFLRDPGKFQKLGGRIPRGVLMVGAPGTGKTLLAKAIAGEAKVPFFSISGSDFVEMFVGVGASRVRDMFEQA